MSLELTFKNIDHTPALDEVIKMKAKKLERFFGEEVIQHWHCWVEHDEQICTIRAHMRGREFFAKGSSENLYKSFDLAIKKIEAQIQHQH